MNIESFAVDPEKGIWVLEISEPEEEAGALETSDPEEMLMRCILTCPHCFIAWQRGEIYCYIEPAGAVYRARICRLYPQQSKKLKFL